MLRSAFAHKLDLTEEAELPETLTSRPQTYAALTPTEIAGISPADALRVANAL